MDEKSKGILLRCARIYFHTKNWPKAISEYENIAASFPDDPHLQEQLSLCYHGNGEKAKAHIHLDRALKLEEAAGRVDKFERLKLKIIEMGMHP